MTFVDPIGDMITRIRNAQMRSLSSVIIPSSKFRVKILVLSWNSDPQLKEPGVDTAYFIRTNVNNFILNHHKKECLKTKQLNTQQRQKTYLS